VKRSTGLEEDDEIIEDKYSENNRFERVTEELRRSLKKLEKKKDYTKNGGLEYIK
jgi:hypothetical protein